MKLVAPKQEQKQFRQNEKKWTKPLMEAGFTVVPSVILERQRALDLDSVDVNILMHLARHWWFAENLPHPSKKGIAECIGIDVSTVRRRIAAMEAAGFIKRVSRYSATTGRQETNIYDLSGLIQSSTPLALEAIQEKKRHQQETESRRGRRKASLSVLRAKRDEQDE